MTRRTRNWLVALVLIPAAAFGAAKLGVWYGVRDTLETVRQSLSPVASLDHTNILSPVFGAVGATGIRIKPHHADQELHVGSVMAHVDNPIDKYELLSATTRGTMPTRLNVSLNGVRLPLGDALADWLDRDAGGAGYLTGAPAACETGMALSVADMKKMGYDLLVANIDMRYDYQRRGKGLAAYFKLELEDLYEVTVQGVVPSTQVAFPMDRWRGMPKVSKLAVSLRDLSWASRLNRYCAKALGITKAQFLQKRLTETRQALADTGLQPSDELMSALERFAKGSARLTVEINPADPVDLAQLTVRNDPDFLLDVLRLDVLIDGDRVAHLGAVKHTESATGEGGVEQLDETFKPTPLGELSRYLKSRVIIITAGGQVHEGYLERIDADKIVLTRHLAGGSATFDVRRTEVESVRVLRR